MLNAGNSVAAVPPLRDELRLLPATPQADGSPSWQVLDPVRNRFFRIGWLEFELLLRWPLATGAAIAGAVAAETTLLASIEDVDALIRFLRQNELVLPSPGQAAPVLAERAASRRGAPLRRLLHHYLFIRLPLLRPGRFLLRLTAMTDGLFSLSFLLLTVLAGGLGGLLAMRQWDVVVARASDSLSAPGFLGYLLALSLAKSLHELAHAVTATRYGVRVAHMGIALVVLTPMLYTDTGESWKVIKHRDRLRIAAAGIAAELILAAWATLAWALLPDGQLRAAFFFLATTSWILSLLVNVSPFMRFDGYFILADALDMPNLHERSAALARLRLRRLLFGIVALDAEPLPLWKARLLALFSAVTWLYRLGVFFGIALAVYHFFFKALGIFLFAVEMAWFIVLPIWRELREWPALRQHLSIRRKLVYLLLLAGGAILLFWPWSTAVHAPGWIFPATQRALYSPQAARLTAVHVTEGQTVAAGQALFELAAPELDDEARRATILAQAYARQASGLPVINQRGEAQAARVFQQARELSEQARAQRRAAERLLLSAPFAGTVRDLADGLRPGAWVNSHLLLARVVDASVWRAELLVAEQDLARIVPGQTVRLYDASEAAAPLTGRVAAIDPARVTALPHAMLDARSGGPVPTRREHDRDVASDALYRVGVVLDATSAASGSEAIRYGRIEAAPQSFWQHGLRPLLAVLVRESGF